MKKFLMYPVYIIILLGALLCIAATLVSCVPKSLQQDEEDLAQYDITVGNGFRLRCVGKDGIVNRLYVHEETGVMYYGREYQGSCITALFNADGTPYLYTDYIHGTIIREESK